MAIRFKETDVRAMGRPAGGVKGIELAKEQPPEDKSGGPDEVVSMVVVPSGIPAAAIQGDGNSGAVLQSPACMILTACVNGFGKRTPVDEYRLQRRGGSGVINIKTTERNGNVVGMAAVCDDDELMLITEKGILIRTRVSEIRETGRNAAGVKLIRVDEGDRLVAMAKIDADAKAEGEAEGGAAEGEAPSDESAPPAAGAGEASEPPVTPE
jgi:DNA gyrase subunit A